MAKLREEGREKDRWCLVGLYIRGAWENGVQVVSEQHYVGEIPVEGSVRSPGLIASAMAFENSRTHRAMTGFFRHSCPLTHDSRRGRGSDTHVV